MKGERMHEYARMLLGPVRYGCKETRAEAIHTLHAMLDEEYNALRKAEKHPPRPDPTKDAVKIAESQRFSAPELAKAGYLAPWKKKLVEMLHL